ncbi:MAG: tRNA (adenosine(37)-N6)-threonylcarbamoyltransferase complex transferase subunit TsaD [Coriobacteriales bacterium]
MTQAKIALAFDTASDMLALCVGDVAPSEPRVIAGADAPAPRQSDQVLLKRAAALLEENGMSPHDVELVVVGRGPGSFTGVRIGIATAKGIACGLGCPVHGVSTIDAVAWRAWRAGLRGRIGVVEDAMRKEVYPVRFELGEQGVERLELDSVCKPAQVAQAWREAGEELVLLGDGLRKHASCFDGAPFTIGSEELWAPDGQGLLQAYAALRRAGGLGSGDPAVLLPVYTRLSDAEEAERARLGIADALPASGVADGRAVGGLFLHPLSVNDVAAAVELQQRAMPQDAWTEGKLADEVGRPDRSWWVARKEGRLVGCAGGQVVDGELCIFSVCVDPEQRRQGIAQRLIERVATDARALAAETVTLEVRTDNSPAIALYRSLGLEDVGVRPRYYHDRADALIMRGQLPLSYSYATAAGSFPMETGGGPRAQAGACAGSARPLILAIESSCDETAAAVVDGDRCIWADQVASQIDFHSRFGGVVPEIASRKHTEAIVPVVMDAMGQAGARWEDLSAVAVTQGPGLVGALVVGLAFAKGLCFATGLPLIGVNHLEGHLYANRYVAPDIETPFIALLVSGGHTMLVHVREWGDYEVLGSTLDDAVGEAFDKVAKALGLGYPGGPIISRFAAAGNPQAIDFPRAMMHSGDLRFSLSGLKTAVVTYINKKNAAGEPVNIPDLAASFQAAVVDVQVHKAWQACRETGCKTLCMGGGVASNPALRAALADKLGRRGVRVVMPDAHACTDNATMIASCAVDLYREGLFTGLDADVIAHMPLRSKGGE